MVESAATHDPPIAPGARDGKPVIACQRLTKVFEGVIGFDLNSLPVILKRFEACSTKILLGLIDPVLPGLCVEPGKQFFSGHYIVVC